MVKNIIMPGDQFAKKGTTAWADWQRSRMKHALKDVNFEARQIVKVIRDMCAGNEPAWQLMTRGDGVGFRTFVEFVTSPEGLKFPDYPNFRGIALSEPGVMNQREFDLLTATTGTGRDESGSEKYSRPSQEHSVSADKSRWLRAIARADPLVRNLFVAGLIDLKLAALLGREDAKAERAVSAIRGLAQNDDDKAYRKAVNDAVRREFAKVPTGLEQLIRAWKKATLAERRAFVQRYGSRGRKAGPR